MRFCTVSTSAGDKPADALFVRSCTLLRNSVTAFSDASARSRASAALAATSSLRLLSAATQCRATSSRCRRRTSVRTALIARRKFRDRRLHLCHALVERGDRFRIRDRRAGLARRHQPGEPESGTTQAVMIAAPANPATEEFARRAPLSVSEPLCKPASGSWAASAPSGPAGGSARNGGRFDPPRPVAARRGGRRHFGRRQIDGRRRALAAASAFGRVRCRALIGHAQFLGESAQPRKQEITQMARAAPISQAVAPAKARSALPHRGARRW